MESYAGYLHATEVLDQISGDMEAFTTCLTALKFGQDGQHKLANGDAKGALQESIKAHTEFEKIPEARYLLAICKQDIAAAYGKLGNFKKAASFAMETINIIRGDRRFLYTEAMAHRTIGASSYLIGNIQEGSTHMTEARRILKTLPDAQKEIAIIDQFEALLRQAAFEEGKE